MLSIKFYLRRRSKISNALSGEGFFRQTRHFPAGILCVSQGEITKSDGKRPANERIDDF
jgi:hypothetical protein